jgi:sulfite reductase beta subunit-like hemoprotein
MTDEFLNAEHESDPAKRLGFTETHIHLHTHTSACTETGTCELNNAFHIQGVYS